MMLNEHAISVLVQYSKSWISLTLHLHTADGLQRNINRNDLVIISASLFDHRGRMYVCCGACEENGDKRLLSLKEQINSREAEQSHCCHWKPPLYELASENKTLWPCSHSWEINKLWRNFLLAKSTAKSNHAKLTVKEVTASLRFVPDIFSETESRMKL